MDIRTRSHCPDQRESEFSQDIYLSIYRQVPGYDLQHLMSQSNTFGRQIFKNIYFLYQIFIVICMHPLIGIYFLIILTYNSSKSSQWFGRI